MDSSEVAGLYGFLVQYDRLKFGLMERFNNCISRIGLRGRLMVGQQTLDLFILVRIQAPKPCAGDLRISDYFLSMV